MKPYAGIVVKDMAFIVQSIVFVPNKKIAILFQIPSLRQGLLNRSANVKRIKNKIQYQQHVILILEERLKE